MRVSRSAAVGVAALLIGLGARPSAAQERGRSAPIIRIYSENGGIVSNYVTPTIQVGEDAYVFAIAMDLTGQIQVLHPAYPGISVRIRQQEQFRLPNFFGGFAQQYAGLSSYSGYNDYGRYDGYSSNDSYSYSENDTRGTVIALASRVPFNLERLESGGDWNMSTIRRLMDRRSPFSAAEALASYIGVRGEPIGRDVMRFASAIHNFYASNYQYGCGVVGGLYSNPYAVSPLSVFIRVAQLRRAGQNVSVLGFDACGMPIVGFGGAQPLANGFPRPPRTHDDSMRAKRGFPHAPGLGPQAGQPNAAAYGYFPVTRRATPQRRDSAGSEIGGRPEKGQRQVAPGEIIIDRRSEPDRRTEPTTVGTQPPREVSRPVLRESPSAQPPRESPPPRMEPTQNSPPPRIEQPQASPPPRMEPRNDPPPSAPPPRMEPRNDPPPSAPPPRMEPRTETRPSSPPPSAAPAPAPRIITTPPPSKG